MHIDNIIKIGQNNNGYITNKDLISQNIPTIYLSRLMQKNIIKKIEKGIYLLEGYPKDDFYTYYLKYSKLIFSRRTALYLNNMTNKQIVNFEANLPKTYHIDQISSIKLYYINDLKYNLGTIEISTPCNNIVKTYDRERCLCDIFLYDFVDQGELKYIIEEYRKQEINYSKLYDYAEKLGILNKIKILLEII